MNELVNFIVSFVSDTGYLGVFILMALESSIFPVPSEAVMIPAGYLVKTGELSMILVLLCGTFGSLLGAIVNYFVLGKYIGKPFLLKYGKYILISNKKYHMTEKLFLKNDILYTFIGRLLPVIRHLISIPAGIFNMKFSYFTIVTTLGACLWCIILTVFGYYFGEGVLEIVHKYTSEANIFVALLLLVAGIYFLKKK